jgi:hypothetical protein
MCRIAMIRGDGVDCLLAIDEILGVGGSYAQMTDHY